MQVIGFIFIGREKGYLMIPLFAIVGKALFRSHLREACFYPSSAKSLRRRFLGMRYKARRSSVESDSENYQCITREKDC